MLYCMYMYMYMYRVRTCEVTLMTYYTMYMYNNIIMLC